MSSERHAGFLRVALVKAGHVDQWAVIREAGRITVELRYDRVRDLFLVVETIEPHAGDENAGTTVRESAHRYLSEAHDAFTTLTLKHR